MDPRLGRFASVDPQNGRKILPSSLHRYVYGDDDPVNRRDPSGKMSLAGTMIALGSLAILGAIAMPKTGLRMSGANWLDHQIANIPILVGVPLIILAAAKGKDPPVPGAKPGRDTKGSTEQWEKEDAGMEEADKDFDDFAPTEVKDLPNGRGGRTGKLNDGRNITVRPYSTDGRPTLQIHGPGRKNVEVRYGKKP